MSPPAIPVHGDDDYLLGRQLAVTAKFVRMWGEKRIAAEGSNLVTWIILSSVADTPAPGLSQRELAARLYIGGPALVRHLDRLEADGILERVADETDRRVTRVHLTPSGRRYVKKLRHTVEAVDRDMLDVLTPAEQATLSRVLEKLLDRASSEMFGAEPAPKGRR